MKRFATLALLFLLVAVGCDRQKTAPTGGKSFVFVSGRLPSGATAEQPPYKSNKFNPGKRTGRQYAPLASVHVVVIPGAYPGGELPSTPQLNALMTEGLGYWIRASYGKTDQNGAPISYGLTKFTYEIAPTQTLAGASGQCNKQFPFDASTPVGDKYLYLEAYDPSCQYGGEAALNSFWMRMNGIISPLTFAHELGHSLGLDHTSALTCQDWIENIANCTARLKSDPYDMMAGGQYLSAWGRYLLGYLTPIELGRDSALFTLRDIEEAPDAFTVMRKDGIAYWCERRNNHLTIRARVFYISFVKQIDFEGFYTDGPGGVTIGWNPAGVNVTTFEPLPEPTPDPNAPTPTEVPTFNAFPTPYTEECWVNKPYIRCSPTPKTTPTPEQAPPAINTALPASATPPPSNTPSVESTPQPPANTPVPELATTETPTTNPTDTPTPDPPSAPTLVPTQTGTKTPVTPRPHGGCGTSGASLGIILTSGGMLGWKRRINRKRRS